MEFGKHAEPISPMISGAIDKGTINLNSEQDLDNFIKSIQNIQEEEKGRTTSINLLKINNGRNTIEFRVPNGTINPNTWIENVKLFGRIVQMSEKLAQIEKKDESEKTQEDIHLEKLMQLLKSNMTENEKMEVLLEILFTEEERNVYRERYYENSRGMEGYNDTISGLTFAEKVDFRKHSIGEFGDVAKENYGGYRYCGVDESVEKETEKGE